MESARSYRGQKSEYRWKEIVLDYEDSAHDVETYCNLYEIAKPHLLKAINSYGKARRSNRELTTQSEAESFIEVMPNKLFSESVKLSTSFRVELELGSSMVLRIR